MYVRGGQMVVSDKVQIYTSEETLPGIEPRTFHKHSECSPTELYCDLQYRVCHFYYLAASHIPIQKATQHINALYLTLYLCKGPH